MKIVQLLFTRATQRVERVFEKSRAQAQQTNQLAWSQYILAQLKLVWVLRYWECDDTAILLLNGTYSAWSLLVSGDIQQRVPTIHYNVRVW